MKKIGILTIYYRTRNIGGLLQAYALANVLEKMGFAAEQICFEQNIFFGWKKHGQKYLLKLEHLSFAKVLNKIFAKIRHMRYHAKIPSLALQHTKMQEFADFIKHSDAVYTDQTIYQVNKKYDAIVIGSDQVFVSYFLSHVAYFGEFASADKKVISYAASTNTKRFHHLAEKLFARKLQRFDAISVRERTLKEYIERITDKKATVVLDPTFLLSPREWQQIARPLSAPPQKYIFCYFLGEKSVWQRKIARRYADKYGYEVVHLPYIMQSMRRADDFLKGQGRYDVGPREFISLINGAECVFTDSFHGLAFSINFEKQFFVFNRDDQAGAQSMSARITDTLDLFGLQSRHITKPADLAAQPIDYTPVRAILAKRRQESLDWLMEALSD